jgi:hypothetical protein
MGGRAGRGRFYWPGIQESAVTAAGVIGGTTVAAWNSAFIQFEIRLLDDDLIPVLLHAEETTLITDPLVITSFSVDGKVATQRRRLRR